MKSHQVSRWFLSAVLLAAIACSAADAPLAPAPQNSNGTANPPATLSKQDTTGELIVTVVTSGDTTDPDGYVIAAGGLEHRRVSASGSVVMGRLPAGQHNVSIADVSELCVVDGPSPRAAHLVARTQVSLLVSVVCMRDQPACENPHAISGAPDPLAPGYIIRLVDGVDPVAESTRLAAKHGFTVRFVYEYTLPGFSTRDVTTRALNGLRCESSIAYIVRDGSVSGF